MEKFAANTAVHANGLGQIAHVGAHCFANIGYFVDIADLDCKKGIGGILGQLRGFDAGTHDGRVTQKKQHVSYKVSS